MSFQFNVGKIVCPPGESYVEWRIEQYVTMGVVKNSIWCSSEFSIFDVKRNLQLNHPDGVDSEGSIDICLCTRGKTTPPSYNVCFSLGIKRNDGVVYKSVQYLKPVNITIDELKFLKFSAVLRKTLGDDGSLTIFCKAWLPEDEMTDAKTSLSDDLSRDFAKLFLSEKSSDVTIKVKDKEFKSHRLILSTRCPILDDKCTRDPKEKTSIVKIDDCNPALFKDFLFFLYSGKTETMSLENVFDLYFIAEKYKVVGLKERCRRFMVEKLSGEIFCDVVVFAVRQKDAKLLEDSSKYFVRNVQKIATTEKWAAFAECYPDQANKLFLATVKR